MLSQSILDQMGVIIVRQTPEQPKGSTHPTMQEECATEFVVHYLKPEAETHPEQPPPQLLRAKLGGVPLAVLSQLRAIRKLWDKTMNSHFL